MAHISFSHKYPKLHGQTTARLLAVEIKDFSELSKDFLEYDTSYNGGKYPLSKGNQLVLVFLGNELIPFTTVRRWIGWKEKFYRSMINCEFEIRIEEKI